MIEIENIVFNTVATALRAAFSGIFVSSETTASPSSFPACTVVEMDDSVYKKTMSLSKIENHASKMYQIEAYSDLPSGRKAQCKAIIAAADAQMSSLGFVRVGNSPSIDSPNYHRRIARYTGVVSAGIISGEDTIYNVYRG